MLISYEVFYVTVNSFENKFEQIKHIVTFFQAQLEHKFIFIYGLQL